MGDLSIGKTFRHQGHNLFLTRSDERFPVSIDHPQRGHLGNQIDQVVDLLRISPDLAAMNHLNALAERPEWRYGKAEEAPRTRKEIEDAYYEMLGMYSNAASPAEHVRKVAA